MTKTVFQFKTSRAAKLKVPYRPTAKPDKWKIKKPSSIQGYTRFSQPELFVSIALSKLDLSYTYQYSVKGGRSRRGGQIIDFMVYTLPLWTAVYVQGDYWHRSAKRNEDLLKMDELMTLMRGKIKRPVELWEYELPDIDKAMEVIRRRVL